MFLVGVVLREGVRILVDTCATHNVIDINFVRLGCLMKRRINTTILISSVNKIDCFNDPLRIDTETF
jgi:hypothetical protein